ncbi:MAG: GNAT family N-acetyltransferase, partial [Candidatus Pacebacteria bacterium]|nr:GNAT family N-acetyltransferase [Candidatus Paceibacterota bacterium]
MTDLKMFVDWHSFTCGTKTGELEGYHCNNPGSLSEHEKKELFRLLYPVALDAFSREHSSGMKEDVWKHIFSSKGLLVVLDNAGQEKRRIVAFRMWDIIWFSVLRGDILYLAGMCVRKQYQKIGIGSSLLKYVLFKDEQRRVRSVDQVCPLPE